jgi:hypothetical protein
MSYNPGQATIDTVKQTLSVALETKTPRDIIRELSLDIPELCDRPLPRSILSGLKNVLEASKTGDEVISPLDLPGIDHLLSTVLIAALEPYADDDLSDLSFGVYAGYLAVRADGFPEHLLNELESCLDEAADLSYTTDKLLWLLKGGGE